MNEIYLKKIDDSIETTLKKKGATFNLDMLINYVISKANTNSSTDESTSAMENILIVYYS
jgi:hypothetical protein